MFLQIYIFYDSHCTWFLFAGAVLFPCGTISAVASSVGPWKIPLRTALVRAPLDTYQVAKRGKFAV